MSMRKSPMKPLVTTLLAFNLLAVPALNCVADEVVAAEVVPADQLANVIVIDAIVDSSDRLSGRITNHGAQRVENVQLLVSYAWLWNDDRRTDDESPGWTEVHTLPLAIEPGQSAPFSVEHQRARPARDDGQLLSTVKVIGLTQWAFQK